MKKLIYILIYCASLSANAEHIVDVYGTDPKQSAELIKKYGSQISTLMAKLNDLAKEPVTPESEKLSNVCFEERMKLINTLKKNYGFTHVDFDTVFYYTDSTLHTTIEVINKDDKHRLRFVNEITKAPPKHLKRDLIEDMIAYQADWGQVMLTQQINVKEIECPVFHCLPGFTHPKLKDQFASFNVRAMREKDLILKTLHEDPNPERRTAAAFLIGHFHDPKEIISILTKQLADKDFMVRNASMRVLNLTLIKSKIYDVDILPILDLLDSPFDTDRNKALLLLQTLANSKKAQKIIIQHGKDKLLALLRLSQPNNHDESYLLLKIISNKDFGPHHYKAWERWLSSNN